MYFSKIKKMSNYHPLHFIKFVSYYSYNILLGPRVHLGMSMLSKTTCVHKFTVLELIKTVILCSLHNHLWFRSVFHNNEFGRG